MGDCHCPPAQPFCCFPCFLPWLYDDLICRQLAYDMAPSRKPQNEAKNKNCVNGINGRRRWVGAQKGAPLGLQGRKKRHYGEYFSFVRLTRQRFWPKFSVAEKEADSSDSGLLWLTHGSHVWPAKTLRRKKLCSHSERGIRRFLPRHAMFINI